MGTRCTLDANFPVLKRRGMYRTRQVRQFCGSLKSQAYLWPATHVLTLMPINLLSTFASDPNFDGCRFRLDEVIHSADWWDEKPLNVEDDPDAPGNLLKLNHFFNAIVNDQNVSGGAHVLGNLIDVQHIDDSLGPDTNESTIPTNAFVSRSIMRANQGFQIRWRLDQSESGIGTLWVFYFGQWCVRCVDTGVAFIYEKESGVYVRKGDWRWLGKHFEGMDGEYQMTIYPHGLNAIEIVSQMSSGTRMNTVQFLDIPLVTSITTGDEHDANAFVYRTTSQTMFGTERIISQSGPWKLAVTPKIRHLIQVSKLTFKNDTGGYDLFDIPIPFGFPIVTEPEFGATYIPHGGNVTCKFVNPDTGLNVDHPLGVSEHGQFSFQVFGKGDILFGTRQIPFSSDSPEVFGYSVRIPPLIEKSDRTPIHVDTLKVRAKLVDAPHKHEYTITVLNEYPRKKAVNVEDWDPVDSPGPLDAYKTRPWIPVRVWDDVTGEVYLEGFCHTIRGTESPAVGPVVLELNCMSMAAILMRHYAIDLDFTAKVAVGEDEFGDNVGQWTWASALRECFAHAGFDDTAVSIEEVERYDFPLWPEGDSNSKSQGNQASAPTQRWRPNPNAPVYKWVDFLIRDVLGWHWDWTRSTLVVPNAGRYTGDVQTDGTFVIFRRPRPAEIANPAIKRPAAAFFASQRGFQRWAASPFYDASLPIYFHRNLRFEAVAPQCTSIRAATYMTGIKTPNTGGTGDAPSASDPDIYMKDGFVVHDWENPDGWDIPGVNHAADRTSPHYMGSQMQRVVNLIQAATLDAFEWMGTRIYEDLCFGTIHRTFDSEWENVTVRMRHWDCVLIDPPSSFDEVGDPNHLAGKYLIDSIEPTWATDFDRIASYKCWKVLAGSAPPR